MAETITRGDIDEVRVAVFYALKNTLSRVELRGGRPEPEEAHTILDLVRAFRALD